MGLEDLADQVDDYICTFEGLGDIVMDSLAMFVFIWSLCALFLIWLGKYAYQKYVKKSGVSTESVAAPKMAASVSSVPIRKSEPKEILRAGSTGGGGGGGGFAKPMRADTPLGGSNTARKRLTRRSPGPEIKQKYRHVPIPQNILGQDVQSTTWVTKTFRWLYSDLTIINEVLHAWTVAVNDFIRTDTKKEDAPIIEIVRVLPESLPPNLTNIYVELTENLNEVLLTCDCDCNPVLQAKAFYESAGKSEVSHYKITVSRFKARLNILVNFISLKGCLRIEGYPDIKLVINPIGPIKTSKEEANTQAAISESLAFALRETMYPIDFSLYATCPRGIDIDPSFDSYSLTTTSEEDYNMYRTRSPTAMSSVSTGRRLLVKILRGEHITNAKETFCIIEMDEPPQKNQTGIKPGENPYWDETFLFNLSQNSAEILFEVYECPMKPDGPPKFMGLGLVGIDELSIGLASTQILALQPRPYETENITGSITVEFIFIESAPINPRAFETSRTIRHPAQSPTINNDSTLSSTNLSPIAKSSPNPARRSIHESPYTMNGTNEIINESHSHQPLKSTVSNPYHRNGLLSPPTTNTNPLNNNNDIYRKNSTSLLNSNSSNSNNLNSNSGLVTTNGDHHNNNNNNNNNAGYQNGQAADLDNRGRPKAKRNFFGNIKKRLTRSKSRSKDKENQNLDLRSVSAERGGNTPNQSQIDQSKSSTLQSTLSRRSSISESSAVSGWSSASAKTFVHESSILVLETIENGVKRHFLVPLNIAQKPRWRRKGTKLHICNDHTFIAKHISGGVLCDVCNKSIMRRPGKQGYECRDCNLRCHKPCHVKTPTQCHKSTISAIELASCPVLTEHNL